MKESLLSLKENQHKISLPILNCSQVLNIFYDWPIKY